MRQECRDTAICTHVKYAKNEFQPRLSMLIHGVITLAVFRTKTILCKNLSHWLCLGLLYFGSIRMNILMLDTRNVEQTKDVRMYT